jgi:hypothetical protein
LERRLLCSPAYLFAVGCKQRGLSDHRNPDRNEQNQKNQTPKHGNHDRNEKNQKNQNPSNLPGQGEAPVSCWSFGFFGFFRSCRGFRASAFGFFGFVRSCRGFGDLTSLAI